MSTMVLEGHTYHIEKLTNLEQFGVAKRVIPLVQGAVIFDFIRRREDFGPALVKEAMGPIIGALRELSDDDARYIFSNCMSKVRRQINEKSSQRMWVPGSDIPQYPDLSFMAMIRLTAEVIVDSLGPFSPDTLESFNGLLQRLS